VGIEDVGGVVLSVAVVLVIEAASRDGAVVESIIHIPPAPFDLASLMTHRFGGVLGNGGVCADVVVAAFDAVGRWSRSGNFVNVVFFLFFFVVVAVVVVEFEDDGAIL